MVTAALMAAVMAILSPISIPIGPVPISLGTFTVFLTGALLPLPFSIVSLGIYIFLGLIGLPVFSNFRGGPPVLIGPTGGYIIGYVFIILAVGLAVKHSSSMVVHFLAAMAGMLMCYGVGTLWFSMVTGTAFLQGLLVCVVPFILPDIMKAVVALLLSKILKSRLGGALGAAG